MATVTPASILSRFNTRMKDSEDTTFSSGEKDEFYAAALDDQYCTKLTRDSSLTVVANQPTYTIPDGFMGNLTDVGYDVNDYGYTRYFDREAFECVDGLLIFSYGYTNIPGGKTLYLIGEKKLETTDAVPDYLVPYIIELMTIEAFEYLKSNLTTRFLRNDITMSEIVASIATHERRAEKLRANLANKRLVRG